MKFHKHEFENVEDYLHHRAPYLLVEKIVSITATEIVTEKVVGDHDAFLKGHFPGAPIMPGAMLQELTTQSAGILIAAHYNPMEEYNTSDPLFNEYALGVLVKVRNARYRGFARPGETLRVSVWLDDHIDNAFNFTASIALGDNTIMRNEFQLMNMPSKVLLGESLERGDM